MATYAYYLTEALKKLDPPTDWSDIVEYVLIATNCCWRHKHCTKQLHKALVVGLRFGIIREINEKYYLYEYAKVGKNGKVTYEFNENPLSPGYQKADESEESDISSSSSSSDQSLCQISEEITKRRKFEESYAQKK